MEIGELWWDKGRIGDNVGFDSVHESLDEVTAHMEKIYEDCEDKEKCYAYVTVLHIPQEEKVKEVFKFYLFWIDGKWEVRNFYVNEKDLKQQGISDDAIEFFNYTGGMQYHPLPFENGCRGNENGGGRVETKRYYDKQAEEEME